MYGLIVKSGDRVDEFTKKKNGTYRIRTPVEPQDPIKDNTLMPLPRTVFKVLSQFVANRASSDVDCKNIDGYTVHKIGSSISLSKYDESFRFNNIIQVWEDTAQDTVGVIGNSFNLRFRLK